jgi:hypothetical protein
MCYYCFHFDVSRHADYLVRPLPSKTRQTKSASPKNIPSKIPLRIKLDFEFDVTAKERRNEIWRQGAYDRNFPCQTLKIRNVSIVVMGS